jgi:CHAT domain-containing protein
MSPAPGFAVGWDAGPSSQMEVSSPNPQTQGSAYRLKFTPPFRSTLRPPERNLPLSQRTLNNFRKDLSELFVAADARAGGPATAPVNQDIINKTKMYGVQLFDSVAPQNVQDELNPKNLYLEVGIDEPLIELAWELLHDGTDFLCLKHRVARFVNVAKETPPSGSPPDPWTEGPLSILIISVPIPLKRNDRQFELLKSAQKETEAIVKIIESLGTAATMKTLIGPKATFAAVWDAIRQGDRYHIVHFSGHAYFDPKDPGNSSLMLFDDDMDAGQILTSFGRRPPVLSFMNGCETAVTGGGQGPQNRFDIFSLARAFLDTGSYFIGNRWKINDDAAATFAEAFYRKLLVDQQPLGQVIRDARIECRAKMPADDFSWASYIYYGDPRLYFRKLV